MKKSVKVIVSLAMAASLSLSGMIMSASADFETKDGKTYYTDESGKKVTGWQTIGDKQYYFSSDGTMKTGWLTMKSGKKYYLKKDGSMATGLVKIGGKQYYFNSKGVMATGDTKIGSKIYKIDDDGVLIKQYKNTAVSIGDKLYFVDKDGKLIKDDIATYGKTKYYVGKNGYAVSENIKIGIYAYIFDAKEGLIDSYIPVTVDVSKNVDNMMPSGITGDLNFKYNSNAKCRKGTLYYEVDFYGELDNKTNLDLGFSVYANFYDEEGKVVETKQLDYIRKIEKGETHKVSKTFYLNYIPSKIIIIEENVYK